ncbi:MAG: hypothetical protein OXC41_07590, partial [Gammaproteobacteria bacterium]|nr:hypothetical protein [Gammaproteobacteria bacterium]
IEVGDDRPLAKALEFHLSLNTVCFHGDGLLWPDKVLVYVTCITGFLPLQANVCELSGIVRKSIDNVFDAVGCHPCSNLDAEICKNDSLPVDLRMRPSTKGKHILEIWKWILTLR